MVSQRLPKWCALVMVAALASGLAAAEPADERSKSGEPSREEPSNPYLKAARKERPADDVPTFTNDDLARGSSKDAAAEGESPDGVPAPAEPTAEPTKGTPPGEPRETDEKTAPPGEEAPRDPLEWMEARKTSAQERQASLAEAEAKVTAAEARVRKLESAILALRNPLLTRRVSTKRPEDEEKAEADGWDSMNNQGRLESAEKELEQARQELADARAELAAIR